VHNSISDKINTIREPGGLPHVVLKEVTAHGCPWLPMQMLGPCPGLCPACNAVHPTTLFLHCPICICTWHHQMCGVNNVYTIMNQRSQSNPNCTAQHLQSGTLSMFEIWRCFMLCINLIALPPPGSSPLPWFCTSSTHTHEIRTIRPLVGWFRSCGAMKPSLSKENG